MPGRAGWGGVRAPSCRRPSLTALLFPPRQELVRLHREQERELLGAGRDGELRPGPVQMRLEPVPLPAHPGVSSRGGDLGREGKRMATHRQAPAAKPVAAAAPRAVPGTPKKRTAGAGGRVPPSGPQHAPNKALALLARVRLPKLIRARLSALLVRTAGRLRRDAGRPHGHTSSRAAWRGGGGRAGRFPWAAGAPAPAGSAPTHPRRRPKLVLWVLLCAWIPVRSGEGEPGT